MQEHCVAFVLVFALIVSCSLAASAQDQSADTPATRQKTKHHGGRDDLDAIGTRKLFKDTGWYSIGTEIKVGKEQSQQIEASMKLLEDALVNGYIDRIGQNLVHNSDAAVPFTIKVIDSNNIAIFALPGGFLYVTTGMIRYSDSEAELAGVMAHGIAHVAARHAMRMKMRKEIADIMTVPVIFIGGSGLVTGDSGLRVSARELSGLRLPLTFLRFSRDYEVEADYFGVQYLYQAGYEPEGFVRFLEKLEKEEPAKPNQLDRSLATRPPAAERIKATRKEISSILPRRNHSISNTPEFDQIKARLGSHEQTFNTEERTKQRT